MFSFSQEDPPPKRRKTAFACNECRERKRKCDGIRPVCGACTKKSLQLTCIFEDEKVKNGWDKKYVDSLHARIKELETTQAFKNNQVEELVASTSAAELETRSPYHCSQPQLNERLAEVGQDAIQQEILSDFSRLLDSDPEDLLSSVPSVKRKGLLDFNSRSPPEEIISLVDRNSESSVLGTTCSRQPPTLSSNGIVSDGGSDCDSEDGAIDAMGSTSGNLHHDTTSIRQTSTAYFGPSSAVTFMSYLQNSIKGSTGLSPNIEDSGECQADLAHGKEPAGRVRKTNVGESINEEGVGFNPLEFSLPFRKQADALISSYWVSVYSLYPFLHKATFLARYAEIWEPSGNETHCLGPQRYGRKKHALTIPHEKLFYCTLNVVFALGCSFHPDLNAHDRTSMSDVYFRRAKKLMTFDTLDRGSLQLVQTLLLLGQYLQSTEMVSSCWNIVGLAIRIAQGIGLHLDDPESVRCSSATECRENKTNQMQVEMRRRVWGGCILLDRVLSMTYGRPSMVSPADARSMVLPSIIDDEYLTVDNEPPGSQPIDVPCKMAFYVHALKLQEVLGQILTALYAGATDQLANSFKQYAGSRNDLNCNPSNPIERTISSDFQTILALDSSLTKWQRELPQQLEFDDQEPRSAPKQFDIHVFATECTNREAVEILFVRQRNVLHARYLHTRILLFRPLLLALLEGAQDSTAGLLRENLANTILEKTILTKISTSCVVAAQNLVDLITDCEDQGNRALPAWWYNVFYIYTCAIVLLAARLCAPTEKWALKSSLIQSWDKCLKFLEKYRLSSRQARNCYKVLQLISVQFHEQQYGLESSHFPATHGQMLVDAANMQSSTKEAAVDLNSDTLKEYRRNKDFSEAHLMDSELHNTDECFGLESFHHGNGFPGVRHSLDMAWLTSMPIATGLNETGNIDGTFEW